MGPGSSGRQAGGQFMRMTGRGMPQRRCTRSATGSLTASVPEASRAQVALAPADQLPDHARHPRQARGLGVVVGDVVHEPATEPTRRLADHGQHDERLGMEHVGLGGRRHHRVRPGPDPPGVGDDLQQPPERVAQPVEPARRLGRQHRPLRVEPEQPADDPPDAPRAAAAGRVEMRRSRSMRLSRTPAAELLLGGQRRVRPGEDAHRVAVLGERPGGAQLARVELERVGHHEGDVEAPRGPRHQRRPRSSRPSTSSGADGAPRRPASRAAP